MTIQTLALVVVSWVLPAERFRERVDDLPFWERHPAEQKALRDQADREIRLRTRFPQGW